LGGKSFPKYLRISAKSRFCVGGTFYSRTLYKKMCFFSKHSVLYYLSKSHPHPTDSIIQELGLNTIRYDRPTIEKFNVDSKGECDQLNLAHKTKLRQRNTTAHLVQ